MYPLVTVICLAYNHEQFVREALESVFSQTWPNLQIIVCDDASEDKTVNEISKALQGRQGAEFKLNRKNLGICRTFNEALKSAEGKYVIDFAADDVMLPDMVESLVNKFEALPDHYGLVHAKAECMDASGRPKGTSNSGGKPVPEGDVYSEVVKRFYIAPPATIFKKKMLSMLGGYDEDILYEDFDLWVRAARTFRFAYLDKVVVRKRIHSASLSAQFYKKRNRLQESTFRVCEKILWLNRCENENLALAVRIRFEMRQALFMGNFQLVRKYLKMLKKLQALKLTDKVIKIAAKFNLDLFPFYRLYLRLFTEVS